LVDTTILDTRKIEAFIKFENELLKMQSTNNDYFCNTKIDYKIESKYLNFEGVDLKCTWDGFLKLSCKFFGNRKNVLNFFLPIVIFIFSCSQNKVIYSSYKVNTYLTDTSVRFLRVSSLISCGEYLIEFKLLTNIETEIKMQYGSQTQKQSYDTIGVYLLKTKSDKYFEFDSFSLEAKIIKTGLLHEKETGTKGVSKLPDTLPKGVFFTVPRDTSINGIKCYQTELASSFSPVTDTSFSILLIKEKNFNSLFRIFGSEFVDKRYCIVGSSLFYKKEQAGFYDEIEGLRPLTITEENICESMIKKSKNCIIDTITGFK
jgi:hypothetical protein